MSTDYYLLCHEKKIYMPIFTVGPFRSSQVSKYWMEYFLIECSPCRIELVDEHSEQFEKLDRDTWRFVNAWVRHLNDI